MIDVLRFGADREDAQNRIGLGELHHDVVLFFEKVVELEAIDIEMVEADDEFAFVVVKGAMGKKCSRPSSMKPGILWISWRA
jgi:hypothetical protein